MRIGVWIDHEYQRALGGGFSYLSRLLEAMDQRTYGDGIEIVFLSQNPEAAQQKLNKKLLVEPKSFKVDLISAIAQWAKPLPVVGRWLDAKAERLQRQHHKHWLDSERVGMIFYPRPHQVAIKGIPFVSLSWDIGHRSTFPFPEVSGLSVYGRREQHFTNELVHAILVLAESEAGRAEFLRFFPTFERRLRVMPIFPGLVIQLEVAQARQDEILRHHGLEKSGFFLYPAQLWAHKNHHNLLEAFALYCQKGNGRRLVLTGSDLGKRAFLEQNIQRLGIARKVDYLGFVEDETLFTLYKNAWALVFASFLGPTNMPPLEAAWLGCPVLCSDLAGHREMMGDAALYFDPVSAQQICQRMIAIDAPELRQTMAERAQRKAAESKFNIDNALQALDEALALAVTVRSCWP